MATHQFIKHKCPKSSSHTSIPDIETSTCYCKFDSADANGNLMMKLSDISRAKAIGMLQAGLTKKDVAAQMGVCSKTIQRLQQRYQQSGSVKDRPRSGRPRVTNAVDTLDIE